ncbi:uncharacterized protein LOC128250516 isoform X1 [Octopus bimaculoides]|uniref:uncharacterized protein LOC128250516 isoform X1 n=1 Tax=Octopus bimaculoides TaxID=37653 RepID=UPI0022E50FA8|nr:uncharacterized protein LOC128250516 isoform X1 [Octopus bimaculoides]
MKGISVLLFCVFISYTLSDKQNVAPFHQQTGASVGFHDMIKRDKPKESACSKDECYQSMPSKYCCEGLTCSCSREEKKCTCNSQDIIHGTHNSILQSVIAVLIFFVNLPTC